MSPMATLWNNYHYATRNALHIAPDRAYRVYISQRHKPLSRRNTSCATLQGEFYAKTNESPHEPIRVLHVWLYNAEMARQMPRLRKF